LIGPMLPCVHEELEFLLGFVVTHWNALLFYDLKLLEDLSKSLAVGLVD
jgi:hypothetical protein